jgi:glycosyltransferase involved in cell wall biosynthesis
MVSEETLVAHDSVTAYGGSERTLEVILGLVPDAPLYTAIFRPQVALTNLGSRLVRSSPLQHLPVPIQMLKPLFPLAFANFQVPEDRRVVLSNSSGYAKGIRVSSQATHVCYVQTPLRRVWNAYHRAARRTAGWGPGRALELATLAALRRWDLRTMRRVDILVANSRNTEQQIRAIYGREATVVHPPVRTSYFVPANGRARDGYFLVVSRLDPYKRIDLAVDVANRLRVPLLVVGDGVERQRLAQRAGETVTLAGWVPDAELCRLYQGCRALIFPGEEDFGIVPVEAQACGTPVIAFAAGGSLETVIDGVTGVLFRSQTVEDLAAAVDRFDPVEFDADRIRRHAEKFGEDRFRAEFAEILRRAAPNPRVNQVRGPSADTPPGRGRP